VYDVRDDVSVIERTVVESSIWRVMLWGFGTCITGFLFLAGWMWWIVGKLHDKVSYEWIENQFQKDMNKKIDMMNKTLVDIRVALVGDYQSKGLITRLIDMEEKCNENHPKRV